MNSKNKLLVIIVLLTVFSLYSLYWNIDNGITISYMDVSIESEVYYRKQTTALANLNVIGRTADEVIALAPASIYGAKPFEKEGCLYYGQVCLRLDEQRVILGFSVD